MKNYCLGCTKRESGCHSKCATYIENRLLHQVEKDAIRAAKVCPIDSAKTKSHTNKIFKSSRVRRIEIK